MNLTSISQVRQALDRLGMRPSKALGQNFLIDLNILNIFLDAAEISPDDQVVEIGPGLGVVTSRLLDMAARVIAIEKDARLFEFVRSEFGGNKRLELIHADMLELDADSLLRRGPAKVVSSLPYSAGSRILVNLAMCESRPSRMTVLLQEDVADRLLAPPGRKNYGMFTVWMRTDYEITRVKSVSPTCFWPRPEVKSAIVNMTKIEAAPFSAGEREFFYDFTKWCFIHRRKQLATILAGLPPRFSLSGVSSLELLQEIGIERAARPENLSVDDWRRLAARWRCFLADRQER